MSKVNVHSEIGSRFGFKDRQPRLCQSNLIYKYTCESCKAFYIGKTERQFGLRICEHQNISAHTGKELNPSPRQTFFIILKHVNPRSTQTISLWLIPTVQEMDF